MFTKVLIADRGELAPRIARTCQRLGITTVGVRSDADPDGARDCDEVAVVPDGPLQVETVLTLAREHAVQAVHPGGGMPDAAMLAARLVEAEVTWVGPQPELLAQLEQQEAFAMIATRSGVRPPPRAAPERARYLAATIAGDGTGQVTVLGDHEASLRNEDGPLLEEASAPGLTFLSRGDYKREVLADCAKRLAAEVSLRGLARIGFTLDVDGGLHLHDLSPYLAPVHALTEAQSGLDLVELQLRLAHGEPLPEQLRALRLAGHAVAAHVRLKAPAKDAVVESLRFPPMPPGTLRIESVLAPPTKLRDEARALAHVIAHSQTRHEALLCLDRALAEAVIAPLETNVPLLRAILGNEAFRAGQYDTVFAASIVP